MFGLGVILPLEGENELPSHTDWGVTLDRGLRQFSPKGKHILNEGTALG